MDASLFWQLRFSAGVFGTNRSIAEHSPFEGGPDTGISARWLVTSCAALQE
jgi:hypothetical protein